MEGEGVRVALEKMGVIPEREYLETDEMAIGTKVESLILDAYEQSEPGIELLRSPDTIMHPELKWMGCHADALWPRVLNVESKSVGWYRRNLWGEGGDEIPEDTMWQVQEQMEVLQLPLTKLPVLFINEENLRLLFLEKLPKIDVFVVPRDREIGAYIIEKSLKVWNCIVTETLPEPEIPSDVRLVYRKGDGAAVEADDAAVEAYDRWFDADARLKQAEIDVKRAKYDMQLAMKEAAELRYRGRTLATWKLGKGKAAHSVKASEPSRTFLPKTLHDKSITEYLRGIE